MSIYQTIVKDIITAIQEGKLEKGSKLPSIRFLSQEYSCSKDTAQRALLELKHQNYIYAVPKSGYYVLEGKSKRSDIPLLNLSDFNRMAYEDFHLCLDESLEGHQDYLFNYYHNQSGLKALIQALQKYLSNKAIYAQQNQIVITSGSQQALYILSQMDFGNGSQKILLEQPTYHRMNQLVTKQNLPYDTIQRDFTGLDFTLLEQLFQTGDYKFFYTISRYSNPLGLSYSAQEKEKLAQLADKYQVYIIEDDYLGDFVDNKNLPIHYYDTHDRIIYLKSFSMALFPGLRLGSLVLPPQLKEAFIAHKNLIDYDTNLIMQRALAVYLDNGMYDKNIKKLRDLFNQTMSKSQQLIRHSTCLFPYQLSLRHVTWQIPKNVSMADIRNHTQARFLETSFLDYSVQAFLQVSHGDELKQFLEIIDKSTKNQY